MSSLYTSTVNDLIAGSFGGAAQVLVGQPLDTIKTRAQIAPSESTLSTAFFRLIYGHPRACNIEGMFVSRVSFH